MTDIKITNLPSIPDVESDDILLMIDVSDETGGPNGTDKRATVGQVKELLGVVQTTGSSTTDIMSQKAVSDELDTKLDASYMTLKIFQSPTDGGLTEIETRTVDAGEVYEVRKASDDSLATIYSDADGITKIVQDGDDNKSGSDGVVEFYIADGDYYVEAGGVKSNFEVDVLRKDLTNPDKGAAILARGVVAVDSITDLLALPEGQRKEGLRYLVKGYHTGSDAGGGEFYYDPNVNGSEHNGGTIIDPDAPFPNDWNVDSLRDLWFSSSNTSNGVFVRVNYDTLCYSDFGAKLDGVNLENHEIINTHLFCNDHDIDIKVSKKDSIIYFSGEAIAKTSVDYNMATILCTMENRYGRYVFSSDEEFIEIPNLTKITADYENTLIPELDHLDTNVVVKISDTDAYCVRQDTAPSPSYRSDILLHNFLGTFSTPVCYKYDQSHNVKVEYRKLDKPRGIYNLKVVSEMPRERVGGFAILVSRDNFKIRDIIVDPTVESMILTSGYKGALFDCTDCINLSIKRVTGNNITGLSDNLTANGRSGYVFNLDTINGLHLSKLAIRGAWGAIGSNNIQNLSCYNSVITRIDLHLYGRDFTVRDSTIHDYTVNGSDLHGKLVVDNCTFMSRLKGFRGMIYNNYGSYGSFCPADTHFSNIKIINNTKNVNRVNLFYMSEALLDTAFRGEKKIGDIYLDNITINGEDAGIRDFHIMRTVFRRSTNVEVGEIVVNNIKNKLSDNLYLLAEDGNPFANEVKFKVSNCVLNNYFTKDNVDFNTFFPYSAPTPYIDYSVSGSSLVSIDYYKVVGSLIYLNLNNVNVDNSEVLLRMDNIDRDKCRVNNSIVHAAPAASGYTYPDRMQFRLPKDGTYSNCKFVTRDQFVTTLTKVLIGLNGEAEYIGCKLADNLLDKSRIFYSDNPTLAGHLIFNYIESQENLFNLPMKLSYQYNDGYTP